MARPNPIGIHVVRPSQQNQPSNPPELDPADIVTEALSVIKDCRVALCELEDYKTVIFAEMASRLNHLEVTALRSLVANGRKP